MSFQVGVACFADLQAAGSAACSLFQSVTAISNGGASLSVVTCDSSTVAGELVLKVATAPIGGGVASVTFSTLPASYQPCLYPDFIDAAFVIASAVLGVWTLIYGYKKIAELLNFSRGSDA